MSEITDVQEQLVIGAPEVIEYLKQLSPEQQRNVINSFESTSPSHEVLLRRQREQRDSYEAALLERILELDKIQTLLTDPPHTNMVARKLQRYVEDTYDYDWVIEIEPFSKLRELGKSELDKYKRNGDPANPQFEWYKYISKLTKKYGAFLPGMLDTKDILNTWLDWKYPAEPCAKELLQPFYDHVHEVIANGSQQMFDLFMKFHAHIVQHPMKRMAIAILLLGTTGIGKGFTCNFLGQLFRPHFLPSNDLGHMLGNFNNLMDNILYSYVDNASWKNDPHAEQKLKSLISEPRIIINDKFVTIKNVRNSIHFVFASNERDTQALPIEVEDRRFLVFDVSSKYRNKRADYFVPLAKRIWTPEVFSGLMYDLKHWEISEDDFEDIPNTFGRVQQMALRRNSVVQWLISIAKTDRLEFMETSLNKVIINGDVFILRDDLLEEYEEYWQTHKEYFRHRGEFKSLSDDFSKLLREVITFIPYVQGKQYGKQANFQGKNKYFFPVFSCDELRTCLAKYMDTSVEEFFYGY